MPSTSLQRVPLAEHFPRRRTRLPPDLPPIHCHPPIGSLGFSISALCFLRAVSVPIRRCGLLAPSKGSPRAGAPRLVAPRAVRCRGGAGPSQREGVWQGPSILDV